MKKKIILDNEYAESSYISEYKIAQVIWKKVHIPSEHYRNAITILLEYSKTEPVISYLSDGTLSGAVNPDDRKWFQSDVVPLAEKLGLKHTAVIIKNDPFKKYYMNAILKIVNRNVTYDMKIFYNYNEALDWILKFDDYK